SSSTCTTPPDRRVLGAKGRRKPSLFLWLVQCKSGSHTHDTAHQAAAADPASPVSWRRPWGEAPQALRGGPHQRQCPESSWMQALALTAKGVARMKRVALFVGCVLGWVVGLGAAWAQQPAREVYRCPGNPVLYTDTLSAKEAAAKGCRTLEGAPITIVQAQRPRVAATSASGAAREGRPSERVDPGEQRARDN